MNNIYDGTAFLTANPLTLLLLVIGIYGWWRLLVRDTILDRPRNWFWRQFPHEGFTSEKKPKRGYSVFSGGVWYTQRGTKLGELIHCPFCLSFWVSVAYFGAYFVWPVPILIASLTQLGRVATAFLAEKIG